MNKTWYVAFVALFAIFGISVTYSIYGQTTTKYIAILNGDNVLPPVKTNGFGIAEIVFNNTGPMRFNHEAYYNTTFYNLSPIKTIELKNEAEGFNGTPVFKRFCHSKA